MPYFVYALIDPRDNAIKYIGITNNLAVRFRQHLQGEYSNPEKNDWIRELKVINLQPAINSLETVDSEEQARQQEKYWIQFYLDAGQPLLNMQHMATSPQGSRISHTYIANPDVIISGKEAAEILKCSYPYLFDLMKDKVIHRVPQRNLKGSPQRQPLRFRRRDIEQLARETGKLDESEQESHALAS